MKDKEKILIILPSLAAGGAERVMSFVAQNINADQFDSHLLIIGNKSESIYAFNEIHTTFLNKKRVLYAIPALILFLLKKKPNIVVSSIGHLNTLMALLSPIFYKTKFIIREASVISSIQQFSVNKKSWINWINIFSKISYSWIDCVICQSRDMAEDFRCLYNIHNDKLVIINNPITNITPVKELKSKNNCTKYITIGRLSKEKGHERILNILSKKKKDFHYTIIGNGPEKENILEQVKILGLVSKVTYISHTNNVNKYLKLNDLFLQGSYVEGFPNAVLESCVVGTPVLAFNAPGGTKEIIEHGVNGFIVETEAEYLDYLNTDIDWNPKVVSESVKKKFNKKNILHQYEQLFNQVLK